jgi:glucose-6-phosphate isomerase
MEGALIAQDKYCVDNLKYNDCYKYAVVRNILYKKEKQQKY